MLAPALCLDAALATRDHEESIKGFATDRYLLESAAERRAERSPPISPDGRAERGGAAGGVGGGESGGLPGAAGRARLEAARRPGSGVALQLFDLQADPHELRGRWRKSVARPA